ncbi:aminoglycoside phosphotransferase family protein [Rubellimicrobium arenae]|uniref:aminoglycoside phosphotransferase family protein n=1 Tax=Rubellimicrobium arenae TaxID=2817372 RepID=UPI001B311341|nr:phosphotransferase [Rubellimicrobium arenae]
MPDATPLVSDQEIDPCQEFLAATGVAGWRREPLAGDASGRRYERLWGPEGRTAILMDAQAEPDSVAPFLSIGQHLLSLDLCAPKVLARDGGLLLIEDLGFSHMAGWLDRQPDDTRLLYGVAVDVLGRLQPAPPPEGLVALTPLRAAGMIAPLWEHYAPDTDPRLAAEVTGRLREVLEVHAGTPSVLALRDYHAENLVWRPEREGTDRLGLLDFQDALLAPPEYDLASLLRDARRDTGDELRTAMMRRFAEATGREDAQVTAAAAVLGLQRNLRILGIFARLAHERGKPGYLALMPRVHAHIRADLEHPALSPMADLIGRAVPPPEVRS